MGCVRWSKAVMRGMTLRKEAVVGSIDSRRRRKVVSGLMETRVVMT
jgi:hypothetical protein